MPYSRCIYFFSVKIKMFDFFINIEVTSCLEYFTTHGSDGIFEAIVTYERYWSHDGRELHIFKCLTFYKGIAISVYFLGPFPNFAGFHK